MQRESNERPWLVVVSDGKRETVGSECRTEAEAERVAAGFRDRGVVRDARVIARSDLG
jgi:Mg-chelatase subunit ChlD